jgi:uncharacterized membrane protein YphA (DoxX/SURF4 family)
MSSGRQDAGSGGVILGAMAFVHVSAGFFAPEGVEFTPTLFAAAVTPTLMGLGTLSLDAARARRRTEAEA